MDLLERKRLLDEQSQPGFYSRLKSRITDGAGQLADYAAERGHINTSAGINTVGSLAADALPNDYKLGDVMSGQIEVPGMKQAGKLSEIEMKQAVDKLWANPAMAQDPNKIRFAIEQMEQTRMLQSQAQKPLNNLNDAIPLKREIQAQEQAAAMAPRVTPPATVRPVSNYSDATDLANAQKALAKETLRKKAGEM